MGLNLGGKLAILPAALLALSLFSPANSFAENWTNGISTIGELKYPPGFKHFNYVNVDAPKGGTARISELGTYDTLNPVPNKGNLATSVGLVFETLLKSSMDEPSSSYGLIAESLSYPDDFSSASFRLNPAAKWADGQPVTVEDVIYSFDKVKELDPTKAVYLSLIHI